MRGPLCIDPCIYIYMYVPSGLSLSEAAMEPLVVTDLLTSVVV